MPTTPQPPAAPLSRATVTTDAYRDLMSAFPTGVAVVTSLDGQGQPHGMTCTSLCSVTLNPPTLLLCLALQTGTLAAVRQSGGFAVNLVHARARQAAHVFAGRGARFSQVSWRPSAVIGMPALVEDAFAVAECRAREFTTVGDHEIVLGEVVAITQYPDVPLLYGLRQFGRWSPDPAV